MSYPGIHARRLVILFGEISEIFADEAEKEEELERRIRKRRKRQGMGFE